MSFAIFQTGLDRPAPEALERAFKVLRELVDIDAHTLSSDGYGVLVSDLSHEHAMALHLALDREGVPTAIVDEDEVLELPTARHAKRLDCESDGLLLYDALGRPEEIGWEHVVLISAGFVTLTEFDRTEKTRVVMRGGGGHIPTCPIFLTDITVREHRRARLVLELILDIAPGRLELLGQEGQYNYLGDRLCLRYMDNFAMLVQDLCANARGAVLNRGADSLRNDSTVTLHYPTRHAFEEEITWLLWKKLPFAIEPQVLPEPQ
jgi:hypothetical protein